MATKLYLLSTANALTGTFPTTEQSSQTASWSMVGASSLLTMRGTKGGGQGSFSGTSLANTSLQTAFCGYFASDTLDVNQSVGGAGQTLTLNLANRENNLSMNFGADLRCNVYVWRPSTGAKVGTICDCLTMTGSAEPTTANSERSNSASTSSTSTVSALAGDVIVCEIWQFHTQSAATSYTADVWANGTTETATVNTVVTNHASFLNFSADTLTFGTPSGGVNATLAITLANDTASAGATADVSAQLALTAQNDTASAQSVAAISGSSSLTLQGDTLSSTAGVAATDISATLAVTLQADGLSSQSLVSVAATSSLVNAGDTASAQAQSGVSAVSAITMQPDSASSVAVAQVSVSSSVQLAGDQVQSSLLVAAGAGVSAVMIGDTSASFGIVAISADAANQDLDDSVSSDSSALVSAQSETVVAADIMAASVSVGGVFEPSPERTLFIGAESRTYSGIQSQGRTVYQQSQQRIISLITQSRLASIEAQNRSVTPEPQNRKVAE